MIIVDNPHVPPGFSAAILFSSTFDTNDVDSGTEIKITGANSVRNHICEGLCSPFRLCKQNFCRISNHLINDVWAHFAQNYNISNIWQQRQIVTSRAYLSASVEECFPVYHKGRRVFWNFWQKTISKENSNTWFSHPSRETETAS